MIRLYTYNISDIRSIDEVRDLLDRISPERRDMIKKFRFENDKLRSLFAEVLLRYALREQYGLRSVTILKDQYGKPYLQDHPDIHFNLSHSGDWVVCAVGDSRIGVDVERVEEIDEMPIADDYFAEVERTYLNSISEMNRLDSFYKIWTLKECYTKYDGRGMGVPLDSFAFVLKGERVDFYLEGVRNDTLRFMALDLDEKHKLALCVAADEEIDVIPEVRGLRYSFIIV